MTTKVFDPDTLSFTGTVADANTWLNNVTFHATDVGWTSGSGPTVEGPAEPMVLAMTGRLVGFDSLEGDGVASLRSRFD